MPKREKEVLLDVKDLRVEFGRRKKRQICGCKRCKF